jgi:hypothetical protein
MDTPDPVVPDTTSSTGTYITTIDELTSTQGAIVQKESTDRSALQTVFQPNSDTLKSQLVSWAAQGFPANWVVFTAQTDPPPVCSDGQTRAFYDYVQYLLSSSVQSFITTLNAQVLGVSFNFFLKDPNTIGLNVNRD